MRNLPELIPNDLIEEAKVLNSTLISDVMGGIGTMGYKIKPATNTNKVVGTAITVDLKEGDNLFLHEAIHLAEQGYVLVVNGKQHTKNAYLGELMTLAAKARNINGIIIDGLVRDREFLESVDFPVFSRGFTPVGPLKDGPGKINTPISCGNVTVNPGDLILGDADGVVVVPADHADEIIEEAKIKLKYEKQRIKVILEYEDNRKNGITTVKSIKPSWLEEKIKKYNHL